MNTPKPTPWTSPIGRSITDDVAEIDRDPARRAALDAIAPYEEIAEKVILGRTLKGLTQKELGKLVGTSDTAISRIESGQHLPGTITLDRLGRVLEIEFTLPLQRTDPTLIRAAKPAKPANPPKLVRQVTGSWSPQRLPMAASAKTSKIR